MMGKTAASDAVTSWPMAQVRVAPSPAGDNTWRVFCCAVLDKVAAHEGQRLWRFPQTYPVAGTTICSGELWVMLLHIVAASPCSSVDRAAASGAVCGRSNRPRGTSYALVVFPERNLRNVVGFFLMPGSPACQSRWPTLALAVYEACLGPGLHEGYLRKKCRELTDRLGLAWMVQVKTVHDEEESIWPQPRAHQTYPSVRSR